MIAIHAGDSVLEYEQAWPKVEMDRPEACPLCHTVGHMIVHGRYPRQKPLEATPEPPHPVKVRRWLCTACKRTTSMLPCAGYPVHPPAFLAMTGLCGCPTIIVVQPVRYRERYHFPRLQRSRRWHPWRRYF